MGTILDILGSYIVKAAIIGIILTATVSMNSTMIEKTQMTYLRQNLYLTESVLTSDLSLAGYNAPKPAFTTAAATSLQFGADLVKDGTPDVVRYSLVVSGMVAGSGAIRYALNRTVNGTSMPIGTRLISVNFAYYDSLGRTTTTLAWIKAVKTTIVSESSVIVNGSPLTATRTFTIYPNNL